LPFEPCISDPFEPWEEITLVPPADDPRHLLFGALVEQGKGVRRATAWEAFLEIGQGRRM
jgi:hypothetical protein